MIDDGKKFNDNFFVITSIINSINRFFFKFIFYIKMSPCKMTKTKKISLFFLGGTSYSSRLKKIENINN